MYLDKKIKKGFSKNMENLRKILDLLKDKLHFFHSGLITFPTTLKKQKGFQYRTFSCQIGRETP